MFILTRASFLVGVLLLRFRCMFYFVSFWLSIPVQSIAWEDSYPTWVEWNLKPYN